MCIRDRIKLNEEEINGARAKIIQELDKLAKGEPKVKVELAESLLNTFKNKLEKIGEQAQKTLEDALNNSVWSACQELLEQYKEYIRKLDGEGLFDIGGYNIKDMEAFSAFEMEKPQDIVKDERYVKEERVEVGWHLEKDSGFLPIFKRIIGRGGYHKCTKYEDQEFLLLEDFIRDQLTAVQNEFDEVFIMSKNDIREKVEQIKRKTEEKLKDLDQMVADQMEEIAKMLKSQEELEKHVRDNEEKAKWIKEFVERVESLMTI